MEKSQIKKAKMDETTKELWIGVSLLAIFLLVAYGCTTIDIKVYDGVVTARFFPYLIAGSGIVLSSLHIIFNLFKKYSAKGKAIQASKAAQVKEVTEKTEPPIRWNMIALSLVFMIIYLFLMNILGFIVSSALYLLAQILVLQQNRTVKRVIMVVVISIVTPVIIYLPFRYIFSLVLPLGIFN